MGSLRALLRERKRGEKGFSFIELVIVVAVLGILTAIAIPAYGGIQTTAKLNTVKAMAKTGHTAAVVAQEGMSSSGGGGGQTPAEVIEGLSNDQVKLDFVDASGVVIANPGADICVRATNIAEPTYRGFSGDCSTAAQEPTPGDNGGSTEPVSYVGDTSGRSAMFTINCPVGYNGPNNWAPALAGFNGVQKWSDGDEVAGPAPKTIELGREYKVTLEGTYAGFTGNPTGNACIERVDSWGTDSGVQSLDNALFVIPGSLTSSLTHVAEPPASVTSANALFRFTNFNGDISSWDVSNITSMNAMFHGTTQFNSDISRWDTSNVTDMGIMFSDARAFSRDLSGWDVAQVENFGGFNAGASQFTNDLIPAAFRTEIN